MFLWCHVRHIEAVKIHPERIIQNDKGFVNDLDYDARNSCSRKGF